ncbi:DUF599 domain-containing protein [Mesorhizobium sp. 1B3]|uniref:DUF599 domain-containing protein n=1 Tax=Mesorhizobium sp. 1B3 TaxID=3243599 RepID=UPI003D987288
MADSFPLTTPDLAALVFFLAVWVLYAQSIEGRLFSRESLTSVMNRQREAWMHTMAQRELRMIDTSIMIGLQQGTAFFASTSLIALGGCLALLQQADKVLVVLADLPLLDSPARGLFEFKVLGLTVLLAYSFFKFAWSYRLFNYCSILVGAVPLLRQEHDQGEQIELAVRRAARMNILAGKHFNTGLRGIFFAIGYLGWLIGPLVFAIATLLVLGVLVRRQYFSAARQAVLEPQAGPGKS